MDTINVVTISVDTLKNRESKTLTVGELIEVLSQYNKDEEVLLTTHNGEYCGGIYEDTIEELTIYLEKECD